MMADRPPIPPRMTVKSSARQPWIPVVRAAFRAWPIHSYPGNLLHNADPLITSDITSPVEVKGNISLLSDLAHLANGGNKLS